MPNITLLPTISSATNNTTFVVVDNSLTKRFTYATFKTQLATDLISSGFRGPKGDTGTNGVNGIDGVGIPEGGTPGQVITKYGTTEYISTWTSLAAVSTTGHYSSLIGAPDPYTATSIDSFIDVDTSTTPPSNGQALVWDSASSKWKPFAVGSGIGLSSRTTVVGTTALALNVDQTENCQVSGFKSYLLSKVSTNYPAWVRIYSDATSRTNDASRAEGYDPLPGAGVIAEVITTSGALTQLITPGVLGFNNDETTSSTVYLSVTNKDSTQRVINVSLTLLQLET
jgi:hypothetical protein